MKRWVIAVLGLVVALAFGALIASAQEAKEPEGKTLFLAQKCNSCHTIEAMGVEKKTSTEKTDEKAATTSKKKPPDLSSVGQDVSADWIAKYLKKEETTKDGKKHMKLWKGTAEELTTLSTWLGTMKAEKKAEAKAEKAEKAEKAADTAAKAADTAEKTTDEAAKAAEKAAEKAADTAKDTGGK